MLALARYLMLADQHDRASMYIKGMQYSHDMLICVYRPGDLEFGLR